MKKLMFGLVASLVLVGISYAAPKDRTFSGEIMDSQCAQSGSHDEMMKKEGAKDAKECTDACVKMGSRYVLYNSSTKKTYQLDDQDKPQAFSGQKVTVEGTYNVSTKTIHVVNIQPAS